MANTARPSGFRPHGKVLRSNKYQAGSTCFPGDLVAMASDGQCDPVAAGSTILGAALNYATVGQDLIVSDDPNQRYVVSVSAAAFDAQTDVGNNADHVATTGSTVYKCSAQDLDSTTIAASAAGLTILDFEHRIDNALGSRVDAIVKINEHQIIGVDAFAGV